MVQLGGLVLDRRVVEVGARNDLDDGKRLRLVVADHGDGYLGPDNAFLHEHALAAFARELDGPAQLPALRHARDAEARTVARRLYKERKPQLRDDLVDLLLAQLRPRGQVDPFGCANAGLRVEHLRDLFLGRRGAGQHARERVGDMQDLEKPLDAAVLAVASVQRGERDVVAAARDLLHKAFLRDVEKVNLREARVEQRLAARGAGFERDLALIGPSARQDHDLEGHEFFSVHAAP